MTLIGVAPDFGTFRPAMAAVGGPSLDVNRIFAVTESWGSGEWPDVVASIQAGITPIASTKLSVPWLAASQGAENGRLDGIVNGATSLDVSHLLIKPRLGVHHEPEGDGTPQDFNLLYRFLEQRYKAALEAKGWSLAAIIMGRTLIRQTKWTPEQLDQALAGLTITDVFADIYDKRGVVSGSPWATKTSFQPPTDPKSPFNVYLKWCESRGYTPALCEYSVARLQNDTAGTDRAAAIQTFADWPDSAKFEFVCAYDRNAGGNVIGNWSFAAESAAVRAFGNIYDAPPVTGDCAECEAELAAAKADLITAEAQTAFALNQLDAMTTDRDSLAARIAAHEATPI